MIRFLIPSIVGLCALTAPSETAAQTPSPVETHTVEVEGIATRYHVAGLEHRVAGAAIVILMNGVLAPLEGWRDVLSRLDSSIPRLAYDRPGAGRSAPVDGKLTPDRATAHLVALLQQLGIEPPFVLVSWSWGGPLALDFAARHPRAVTGNVFLDPTVVGVSSESHDALLVRLGGSPIEVDSMNARGDRESREMLARLPPGARSELEVITEMGGEWNPPYPRVPTTILFATKFVPGFTRGSLPSGVEEGEYYRAERAASREVLESRLRDVPSLVFRSLPESSHNVPVDAPNDVVAEIRRILAVLAKP